MWPGFIRKQEITLEDALPSPANEIDIEFLQEQINAQRKEITGLKKAVARLEAKVNRL